MKTTQHYTDISCKATSPVWKFWGGNLDVFWAGEEWGIWREMVWWLAEIATFKMLAELLIGSYNSENEPLTSPSGDLSNSTRNDKKVNLDWRYLQKQFCGKLQIHTQVWVCTMRQKYTVQFWCLFHDQSHNTIQQRCTQNLLGNYNSMEQKEFSTLLQSAEKTNFPACP